MTVTAMPPHNPVCAIHLPAGDDLPFLMASSSIHPTIAAGTPVKPPQHKRPIMAKTNAAIAFWLAPTAGPPVCGPTFCPPNCGGGAPTVGPIGVAQLRQKAASGGFT